MPVETRIEAIKCFTEIASLTFEDIENNDSLKNACRQRLCMYFCLLINQIHTLTKQRSLLEEYWTVKNTKQQAGFENFVRQVAIAISAVLTNNI